MYTHNLACETKRTNTCSSDWCKNVNDKLKRFCTKLFEQKLYFNPFCEQKQM